MVLFQEDGPLNVVDYAYLYLFIMRLTIHLILLFAYLIYLNELSSYCISFISTMQSMYNSVYSCPKATKHFLKISHLIKVHLCT